MNARLLAPWAAASLLACACSSIPPRPPASGSPASDFEATIARMEHTDPASPALLNTRLAYGEYLLARAPGACANRIVLAQEQLGSISVSPKTRVMFPDGWAPAADLEYRLHLARAACGSKDDRAGDLLAAAAAARRAVELYRKELDYHSMVIMQFDVAITLRRLGEKAAALAALEAALAMDREYGFRDDAQDNCKLLLTWEGQPADAARVAVLMRDFPKRWAILKFGWHPTDAKVTFEHRRVYLEDNKIVRGRTVAVFDRRITADQGGGWSVSHTHRLSAYKPGVWPTDRSSRKEKLLLAPAPIPAVDFRVSAAGELQAVTGATAFAARLATTTDKLVRAAAPPGVHTSAIGDAEDRAIIAFSPGMLEAQATQDYQLETAMWIGARLEQGVWYQITAPLSLPGMPQFVIQQQIQFAFTRMTPCASGAATQKCVEIVLHAIPDEKALSDVLADLRNGGIDFLNYDASTEARIVVDPATLLPSAHEEQVYWYASIGKGEGDALLESEHLVTTTTYGAQ